ncbi:hypothetical protein C8J56DRAFT_902580 [Mycena floridula]|nr:hypothetical protein C8J56DRAFT_902580 [Mycena floridula]
MPRRRSRSQDSDSDTGSSNKRPKVDPTDNALTKLMTKATTLVTSTSASSNSHGKCKLVDGQQAQMESNHGLSSKSSSALKDQYRWNSTGEKVLLGLEIQDQFEAPRSIDDGNHGFPHMRSQIGDVVSFFRIALSNNPAQKAGIAYEIRDEAMPTPRILQAATRKKLAYINHVDGIKIPSDISNPGLHSLLTGLFPGLFEILRTANRVDNPLFQEDHDPEYKRYLRPYFLCARENKSTVYLTPNGLYPDGNLLASTCLSQNKGGIKDSYMIFCTRDEILDADFGSGFAKESLLVISQQCDGASSHEGSGSEFNGDASDSEVEVIEAPYTRQKAQNAPSMPYIDPTLVAACKSKRTTN